MTDLHFSFDGDIKLSSVKDLAFVQSSAHSDLQQIYLRLMTEPR
jgi:hypothetical protein